MSRRCPTGKAKHLSRGAAQNELYTRLGEGVRVGSTYRCPLCRNWHITRQVPRAERPAKH